MTQQTHIKGKDDSLENTIDRMQSIFIKSGFDIKQTSWQNPVPSVYSVHVKDQFYPALFTNGKGACKKSTLASALGEFFERLETNYFFSDYLLPDSDGWLYYPNEKKFSLDDYRLCLSKDLWQVYDPSQELEAEDLLSLNDSTDVINAIPLVKEMSGETVYFPMNILSNLYASNGLCAGNTEMEAKVQGLSEVFERWVKAKIFKENLCLPEVPENIIHAMPGVIKAIDALGEQGICVSIRDASLGGEFPVVNVTLFNQHKGQCFASFGAHPIFEVALERTLTESLQGRSLDLLDGFQTPVFDAEAVAEDENIENHFIDSSGLIHARFISTEFDYDFVHWDFDADTASQWTYLNEKVASLGFDVYSAHYQHYGIDAARIIVPGMSEIYPMDELLTRNQNQGRRLREVLAEFEVSDQVSDDFEWLYDEVEMLGFSDHQNVANLIGLLPDAASLWAGYKVVDLKISLAFGFKAYDLVEEGLEYAKHYATSGLLSRYYQIIEYCLDSGMSLEGFVRSKCDDSLSLLFGSDSVSALKTCLQSNDVFWGETVGLSMFENSQKHQDLMHVYKQTNQVKLSPLV